MTIDRPYENRYEVIRRGVLKMTSFIEWYRKEKRLGSTAIEVSIPAVDASFCFIVRAVRVIL